MKAKSVFCRNQAPIKLYSTVTTGKLSVIKIVNIVSGRKKIHMKEKYVEFIKK